MPENGYINKVKPDYPKWQAAWCEHNKEIIQSVSDKSYSYQLGYLAAVRDIVEYLQQDLHIQHEFQHNHYWYAGKIIEGIFNEE